MQALLTHWRQFQTRLLPHWHPADQPILAPLVDRILTHASFEEYIQCPEFGIPSSKLHLGLLPLPYTGDLERAKVFILLLNPGFDPCDYYAINTPAFRQAWLNNLYQQVAEEPYPFFFLNPAFSWTAGARWWRSKLLSVVNKLVADPAHNLTFIQGLQFVSQHIACLELYPYASQSFTSSRLGALPSVKRMREFVSGDLTQRVQHNDVTVIVARQTKNWNLIEHSNVVAYGNGAARGAHLGEKTDGGPAIYNRLQPLLAAWLEKENKSA